MSPDEAAPLAVVLSGGRSSRMGFDKATAVLAGMRMIDRVVAAVTAAGLRPVIAGPHLPGIPATFVADPPDAAGPAAGLVAAMRRHPGTAVFLVGADQPYLRAETVRRLISIPGRLVAPSDRRRQTLCAVYRGDAQPAVEALVGIRSNPSLQALFDLPDAVVVAPATWRTWGEDGRSWLSIDTPEALAGAEAAWPDPPLATLGP